MPPVFAKLAMPAALIAALLVAGYFFYLWSYDRGKNACEAQVAQATAAALLKNSEANDVATTLEMSLAAARARNEGSLLNSIEASHDSLDDAPAAPVIQRSLDGLRRLDAGAAPAH